MARNGADGALSEAPEPGAGSSDTAQRLRRRYPPSPIPKPVLIAVVGVLAAIAVGWLIWIALVNANPAVSARVDAFTVESDRVMSVTVTVDRRDPSVPANCRLVAQAVDFQPVAELRLEVPPGDERLTSLTSSLTTLRRATSARVVDCTSG